MKHEQRLSSVSGPRSVLGVRTLQLWLSRMTCIKAHSHGQRQTAAVQINSSVKKGWESKKNGV